MVRMSARTSQRDPHSAGMPQRTPRPYCTPRPDRGLPPSSPTLNCRRNPARPKRTTGTHGGARHTRKSVPYDSEDHEVVRADGLAAVLRGALGGLMNEPAHVAVETLERITCGVAAGVLDHLLYLRRHEQHFLRRAGAAARLTLFRFGHFVFSCLLK